MLVGINQAMLFLAEYALMALLLGEMIRIQLPGERCIAIGALASGLASIVLLVVLFSPQDTSVEEFFEEQIRGHFFRSMASFETMGENKAEMAEMKAFAERTAEVFAASYPAFLFIGSLISTAANYALIRIACRTNQRPDQTQKQGKMPQTLLPFVLQMPSFPPFPLYSRP
jgi:hypothetical protein